jgi:hypothetical protein
MSRPRARARPRSLGEKARDRYEGCRSSLSPGERAGVRGNSLCRPLCRPQLPIPRSPIPRSPIPRSPIPHSALERGEFTLSRHFVAHFVDPVSPLLHYSITPFFQISRIFHHVRSSENSCFVRMNAGSSRNCLRPKSTQTGQAVLPLPRGEGWGEGKFGFP